MSFTALVIGLAVIAVILFTVAPSVFAGLIDEGANLYTATQLQPKANSNEIICDLRITTDVDLTQDINTGILIVDSKPEFTVNSIDTEWFDCYRQNNFPTNALVNLNHLNDFTQLSFLTAVEGSVTSKIRLIDSTDSNQQVDWNLQKQLKKTENFPPATYSTPLPVDQTFVVTNIPARDYNLELHIDGFFFGSTFDEVNGKIGQPYTDKVFSFDG